MRTPTAARAGYYSCEVCGKLSRFVRSTDVCRCPRCDAPLHLRRPDSLRRTWALLIAAAILYIPANLLPILRTRTLLGEDDNTIMSGVAYFWDDGSFGLAIIVFVASVLVPLLKLGVLSLLAATVRCKTRWRPEQRTRLFRIIEGIGRWSMLDIYVITLTAALVRFGSLAEALPGPGAVPFGAVVVLTMLAARQFDPRLIWDAAEPTGPDNE
jgi:paraquat-inducible protein A